MLRGQGTRSYRPFRSGDDPALMDWKLSAKYGRSFVREPTGRVGGAPLVVVDLPPADAPGAGTVLSAAGEAVEAAVREFGTCSLLVVAGGEVVAFRDREADLAALVRLLAFRDDDVREPALPGPRPGRAPPAAARGRAVGLGPVPPARGRAPGEPRRSRADPVRAGGGPRTSPARSERDVVVYSAGAGDPGHLALIGAAVRRHGRRLRVLLLPAQPGRGRGARAVRHGGGALMDAARVAPDRGHRRRGGRGLARARPRPRPRRARGPARGRSRLGLLDRVRRPVSCVLCLGEAFAVGLGTAAPVLGVLAQPLIAALVVGTEDRTAFALAAVAATAAAGGVLLFRHTLVPLLVVAALAAVVVLALAGLEAWMRRRFSGEHA